MSDKETYEDDIDLKYVKEKVKAIFSNLKTRFKTNFEKEEDEVIVEEKEYASDDNELGWNLIDVDTTKKQTFRSDKFVVYDEKNPTAKVRKVPYLSDAEKTLYKNVFEFIKDLPLVDIETDIKRYFRQYTQDNNLIIDREQVDYILRMLLFEVTGYGPLTTLLEDKDNIEEITIIGLGKKNPVYIYLSKIGWVKTNIYFTNESYVKEMINRMSRIIGRRVTLNEPLMNASLPDGSRLNAVIPPISNNFPIATLRRYKYSPLTPLDLIDFNTLSTEMVALLYLIMQTDSNILIAGNTGSGKTTTLNSLFSFVPSNERIIITEETPEVNIPHEHKVSLRVDKNLGVSMNDLINSTLRMRPDRLIVGEIRDSDEVQSFLNTILAGQGKGSLATFHALSANDAVQRLIKLGMLEQDLNALDLIIVQRRWNIYNLKAGVKKEVRRIVSISEINDGEVENIFEYDYEKERWKFSKSTRLKRKIETTFSDDFNNLYSEFKRRIEKLYKEHNKDKMDMNLFFKKVQL